MHTKRIIPCLDVNNGRVVKGINFVNLKDAGDPVAVGAAYDKAGADELVFLDITASSDSRNIVIDMVRKLRRLYLFRLRLAAVSVQSMISRRFYVRAPIRSVSIPLLSIHHG